MKHNLINYLFIINQCMIQTNNIDISNKRRKANMDSIDQQQEIIERSYKELKKSIKVLDQKKGRQKMKKAEELKAKLKRHMAIVRTYELSLATMSDCTEQMTKSLLKFIQKADNLRRNLQFKANANVTETQIFQQRAEKNQIMEVALQGLNAQKQGKQSLINAIRNLYEMKNIAEQTNIKLNEQLQKLDQIYDNLNDTQGTMKRAQKHIAYFARAVYTDKILIVLIVIIVLAIIVIIVLTALGKNQTTASSDVLK